MSITSKLVLSAATITSVSIIGYVHFKQQLDRAKLHEGVLLDIERQQRRKAENIYMLQQQKDITKQLKQSNPDYINER
ncbi:hypothetical protein RN001_012311 [Aquatica leii]|uniref:Protein PET117 homolog, mitochondrial n=1 Tax=Aquatica leii TaxID=1421715 RepID=A0AAN7P2V4_9COLE|nr:hypothetical protein RN001_012311 [Aquatica leii]